MSRRCHRCTTVGGSRTAPSGAVLHTFASQKQMLRHRTLILINAFPVLSKQHPAAFVLRMSMEAPVGSAKASHYNGSTHW